MIKRIYTPASEIDAQSTSTKPRNGKKKDPITQTSRLKAVLLNSSETSNIQGRNTKTRQSSAAKNKAKSIATKDFKNLTRAKIIDCGFLKFPDHLNYVDNFSSDGERSYLVAVKHELNKTVSEFEFRSADYSPEYGIEYFRVFTDNSGKICKIRNAKSERYFHDLETFPEPVLKLLQDEIDSYRDLAPSIEEVLLHGLLQESDSNKLIDTDTIKISRDVNGKIESVHTIIRHGIQDFYVDSNNDKEGKIQIIFYPDSQEFEFGIQSFFGNTYNFTLSLTEIQEICKSKSTPFPEFLKNVIETPKIQATKDLVFNELLKKTEASQWEEVPGTNSIKLSNPDTKTQFDSVELSLDLDENLHIQAETNDPNFANNVFVSKEKLKQTISELYRERVHYKISLPEALKKLIAIKKQNRLAGA